DLIKSSLNRTIRSADPFREDSAMNTATPASTETLIEEFRVDVPQAAVDDLAERLGRTRWPAALPGAAWERGVPVDYLRELAAYWRDGFDWRPQAARLKAYPPSPRGGG